MSRVRNGQGGEPCRADTFIANWSRQRRVESSRASEPEVSKNIANGCEMSDCFLLSKSKTSKHGNPVKTNEVS